MQSNGGVTTAAARRAPRRSRRSSPGPVGGTIAGVAVARDGLGATCICIDMGGTSFDVSLVVDGAAERREPRSSSRAIPLLTPSSTIHTIGAGGG